MRYQRQEGIVAHERLQNFPITLVGVGSVGSFTALALAKMGITQLRVFDYDRIEDHNLPNQFYKTANVGGYKVDSLYSIVREFTGIYIGVNREAYISQRLDRNVIVCPDTMESRRQTWEQWLAQGGEVFIDARMGGEMAHVFVVRRKTHPQDVTWYQSTLVSDNEVKELPCSERTIIYCVMMIASIICRSVKAIVNGEQEYPREIVYGMRSMISMTDTGTEAKKMEMARG